MSNKASDWAWTIDSLPFASKYLLIYLAKRLNDRTGYAWPSVSRISIDTGMSKSAIRNNLNKLIGAGLVVTQQQFYLSTMQSGSCRYYLPEIAPPPTDTSRAVPVPGGWDVDGTWDPEAEDYPFAE